MSDRPFLGCPECGEPLIPAHGRGRSNVDCEPIEHRDECRCRWCEWIWYDDRPPVTCACGAVAKVYIDDHAAYAKGLPYV